MRYRRYMTSRTVRRVLTVMLPALLAGLALALSEAPASADPLPVTFQIKSVAYGQCAYPQSGAPHYVRMDPCVATDLSEQWFYDPVTLQVTNARSATIGLCLDYQANNLLELVMTTCDTSNVHQQWNEFTYNGIMYMAQANGSANVVTASTGNWAVYQWGYRLSLQAMTFPLL